jgi:hypothetical protein
VLLPSDVPFRCRFSFAKLWRSYTAKDKLEEMNFDGAFKVVSTMEGEDYIKGEGKYLVMSAS